MPMGKLNSKVFSKSAVKKDSQYVGIIMSYKINDVTILPSPNWQSLHYNFLLEWLGLLTINYYHWASGAKHSLGTGVMMLYKRIMYNETLPWQTFH